MKRICLLLACLLALMAFAGAAENDDMTDALRAEAISPDQSGTFTISYWVCRLQSEEDEWDTGGLHYELVLVNQTGRGLRNVRFTAYLSEPLRAILVSPTWYNEPVRLGAAEGGELPLGAGFGWSPAVVREELAEREDISLDDFYDMLVEIVWSGGREVIRLDREAASLPEDAPGDRALLSEEDVADLLAWAAG